MENTFNLKKFLAEGKLLKEEQEGNIVDFLNQHKDEAFEKIIKPAVDDKIKNSSVDYSKIPPGEFGIDPELNKGWSPSESPDFEGCAEYVIDAGYIGTAWVAQFEPFTDPDVLDVSDEQFEYINANPYMIAGKKVYVSSYAF